LISWHFISPKHIFYFNVDKEASASGLGTSSLRPLPGLCPWILLGDFRPKTPAMSSPTMETGRSL